MKQFKSISVLVILIISSAYISSCSSNNEVTEEETDQESEAVQQNESADLSIEDHLSCMGIIDVFPEDKAQVHSPVNGIIQKVSVHEGQKVTAGQELARIKHQEIIKIQEEYLKSKSNLELYEKEFNRKQSLFEKSTISEREFLEAKNNYLNAKASFESFKNQLAIIGISTSNAEKGEFTSEISIKAPISGYITHIAINKGSNSAQDVELFEIVNDDKKFLKLKVFSNDMSKVKIGQKVQFKMNNGDSTHTGTVARIGKMVDLTDKSINVIVDLEGSREGLIIGSSMFAEIKL